MHLHVWRCKHLPSWSEFACLTWQYILIALLLMGEIGAAIGSGGPAGLLPLKLRSAQS